MTLTRVRITCLLLANIWHGWHCARVVWSQNSKPCSLPENRTSGDQVFQDGYSLYSLPSPILSQLCHIDQCMDDLFHYRKFRADRMHRLLSVRHTPAGSGMCLAEMIWSNSINADKSAHIGSKPMEQCWIVWPLAKHITSMLNSMATCQTHHISAE